jgi:hypothetical protein
MYRTVGRSPVPGLSQPLARADAAYGHASSAGAARVFGAPDSARARRARTADAAIAAYLAAMVGFLALDIQARSTLGSVEHGAD